jgi:large subunit ribosomal protein L5
MADYTPRLIARYHDTVVPALQKKFGYKNIMEVPKIEKIVVNMGVGEAVQDSKLMDRSMEDMSIVTGQKPSITIATKSISNFKLRAGNKVGCKVTLRRWRMYEFLDRLINIAVPRIRDFRGLPDRSFDGRGNYNMGVKEQIVFPEIDYDKIDHVRGMDVAITTTAKTDEEAHELLLAFGMPFRKANVS